MISDRHGGEPDLNHAFIQVFEGLKAEINRRAQARDSFKFELDLAASRDGAIERRKGILQYIRQVRDALQHPHNAVQGPPFRISPALVQHARGLLEALRNPPTASTLSVPRGRLYVARIESKVTEIAGHMKAKRYSHVPVVDGGDRLLGVFNEAAIFDYFLSEEIIASEEGLTIEGIMKHCSFDADHTETFDFVQPSTPEGDLIARLTLDMAGSTRVGALFITSSGKRTEPIVGMLTPWDVLASKRP